MSSTDKQSVKKMALVSANEATMMLQKVQAVEEDNEATK